MAMSVSGDWTSEAANLPSAAPRGVAQVALAGGEQDLVVERDFDRLQVVFVRDGFHLRALDFLEFGFLLVHPAADQRAYSGSETRADRCSDGRALAASGHRADSRRRATAPPPPPIVAPCPVLLMFWNAAHPVVSSAAAIMAAMDPLVVLIVISFCFT